MQEFRRFVRGPAGKVLLAVIILPFIISGFYGYFTGGGDSVTVAEVDGNKIDRNYVNARTERLRQMLRQQSPDMNQAMLDAFVRPEMVLEGIINEQLTLSAANNAKMAFSDVQAASEIRSNQAFFDNGRFSDEQFERLLRSQGMTPRTYLEGYRQDRLTQQYRFAFTGTDFALPDELAEQRRLVEQTRDLRYVRLSVAALGDDFAVTDEQVNDFYQDNQDRFMRPERYRISYLTLSPEQYTAQVSVSDEQVRAEYEARRTLAHSRGGSREVAHILVSTEDRSSQDAMQRAREARDAIEGGEAFADAAKTYSDDPGSADAGGNLGVLAAGSLPEELEAALADMQVGDISEPVISDSGVHLLTLLDQEKQEFPPLEDMHDTIVTDLKAAQAQTLLMDGLAEMEELVFEHSDLQTPAEQLGMELQTTDWVAMDQLPAVLNSARVREALNSPAVSEQGHNSDVLEVEGGRYVAVHILDRQEPQPLPLEQVAGQIRNTLEEQQAKEKAQSLAEQARELAGSPDKGLNDIAVLVGVDTEESKGVHRGARQPAPVVVAEAFALPRAEEGGATDIQVVDLPNGDWVAFQVTGVTDGDQTSLAEREQQEALRQMGEQEGERSYEQVMSFLRDTRDVSIRQERLGARQE